MYSVTILFHYSNTVSFLMIGYVSLLYHLYYLSNSFLLNPVAVLTCARWGGQRGGREKRERPRLNIMNEGAWGFESPPLHPPDAHVINWWPPYSLGPTTYNLPWLNYVVRTCEQVDLSFKRLRWRVQKNTMPNEMASSTKESWPELLGKVFALQ